MAGYVFSPVSWLTVRRSKAASRTRMPTLLVAPLSGSLPHRVSHSPITLLSARVVAVVAGPGVARILRLQHDIIGIGRYLNGRCSDRRRN
jgi:hypothetical protein